MMDDIIWFVTHDTCTGHRVQISLLCAVLWSDEQGSTHPPYNFISIELISMVCVSIKQFIKNIEYPRLI